MWHADMLNLPERATARLGLHCARLPQHVPRLGSDETEHDSTLAEIALSHRVGTKTEKAYARSVMVNKTPEIDARLAKFADGRVRSFYIPSRLFRPSSVSGTGRV